MAIFRDFRRLVEGVEALEGPLAELVEIQRQLAPALERLDALESARHQFEAEVQSMVLKAEGKLKAAANSEARERLLKRRHEELVDEFGPDGEGRAPDTGDAVLPVDVEASEAESLQALRLGVASNNKTYALRSKFGL